MDIIQFLTEKQIPFETNISLKQRTWIHRGGIVGVWIEPITTNQLISVVNFLSKERLCFEVIGHTSNLYFLNECNPQIVLSTRKLNHFSDEENALICECGTNMKILAKYSIEHGYKGFEGLIDLPGTVAAAIYNNSGCYGCKVSDLLISFQYLDEKGCIHTLNANDMQYTHRNSILKQRKQTIVNRIMGGVIITVSLKKCQVDEKDSLLSQAEINKINRRTFQECPIQNLGSTYSSIPYRILPRIIIRCISDFSAIIKLSAKTKSRLIKTVLLNLYGYKRISHYISDYNIGCFVWKDENADNAFILYRRFVESISNKPTLEIEIRTDKT